MLADADENTPDFGLVSAMINYLRGFSFVSLGVATGVLTVGPFNAMSSSHKYHKAFWHSAEQHCCTPLKRELSQIIQKRQHKTQGILQ